MSWSTRQVTWRCAERGVGKGGLAQCGAFPIALGERGVHFLNLSYVRPSGAAGALTVPFEIVGRELRVDVTLNEAEGDLWLRGVQPWFEPPEGLSIERRAEGNRFRLVNASAFDLVVIGEEIIETGAIAYGGLLSMSTPLGNGCDICGNGIHMLLVRRGTSIPLVVPCHATGPGRYAVVVSARLRAPGLPNDLGHGCVSPCSVMDTRDAVVAEIRSQLEPVAIWTDLRVDAEGQAPERDADTSFRELIRRHPPIERWSTTRVRDPHYLRHPIDVGDKHDEREALDHELPDARRWGWKGRPEPRVLRGKLDGVDDGREEARAKPSLLLLVEHNRLVELGERLRENLELHSKPCAALI
jgi:hypothetical protein